jgi:hypothetical protein
MPPCDVQADWQTCELACVPGVEAHARASAGHPTCAGMRARCAQVHGPPTGKQTSKTWMHANNMAK